MSSFQKVGQLDRAWPNKYATLSDLSVAGLPPVRYHSDYELKPTIFHIIYQFLCQDELYASVW